MGLKSLFAAVAGLLFSGAAIAQQDIPEPSPVSPVVTPAPTPDTMLYLDLSTGGRVAIQLRPDVAPNHVERIRTLTRQGFYDGLIFHRVIEGFMAQGGDPTGTGAGGSPLPDLAAEFNVLPHVRGAVSAARASDVNSANSQFYIMLAPRLALDNKYTVFGRVTSGMQYVDQIHRGEPPADPSRIVRASIGADNVPALSPAEIQTLAAQQAAASAARAAAAAATAPAAPPVAPPAAAAEAPAAEAPATDTPAATEAPVADAPAAEAPVAETPVAETPVAETPVSETPVAEEPSAAEVMAETDAADAAEAPPAEQPETADTPEA